MNHRISKVIGEIEKMRAKIGKYQSRLKELEQTKTELENADIVAMVRNIDMSPAELEAFARAFMEQRISAAVQDMFSPPDGRYDENRAEGIDAVHMDTEAGSGMECAGGEGDKNEE